jgi:biopolymer transport protein TolR
MAMRAGGRNGGPNAEINVTPMADIMIVLLIIFMVATPLISRSGVNLPPARNARDQARSRIVVVLMRDGGLAVEGSVARDVAAVSSEVRTRMDGKTDGSRLVHLKADGALPYAEVQRVMEMLKALGVAEVALMTSPRAGA